MSMQQAQEEVQRRWRALGGWAQQRVRYDHRLQTDYTECSIGIREHDTHGTRKITLGRGRTFETCFAMADRREEREAQPRKPRPRKVNPKALPQEEMPL